MTEDQPVGRSATALGALDVRVWCRRTELIDRDTLEAAKAVLSLEERARADRFHFDVDRRDYIVAHELLRRTLSRYGEDRPSAWAFEAEPGGRPRLCAPASSPDTLSFSLSHTRGFVACAVARGCDVGVDIERGDRRLAAEDLERVALSAAERDALRRIEDSSHATRVVELWTLKEAYAKATGEGLAADLSAASFAMIGDTALGFEGPGAERGAWWHFALFAPWPSSGVRLAVAARAAVSESLRMRAMREESGHDVEADVRAQCLTPLRTSR